MIVDEPRPDGGAGPEAATDAPADDGGYRVRLERFEGPLDLLLHLVRIHSIDITDIPIVEITDQYNRHLELMREMDLEVAGEFLVMAATLMHIKSRMLLPPDPSEEPDEREDPRAELTRELLEYQRFKQAAENLQAIDSSRSLVWTREQVPAEFRDEELLAVDMFDLLKAFRGLLGRLGEQARLELRREQVSVADKIQWLTDLLETRRSLDLLALLEDLATRLDRIATFLAVLEMIRLQMIVAFQRKLFGDIRIALREPGPDDGPAERDGGET